jgi:penicillin amidase
VRAETESVVAGMLADVVITTDEWGIPHVAADSARDAFFGQGYAQARLRLFQMDLWRRRGLGLLSEVLGADYLELDIAARTFLARNDEAEEYAAYSKRARDHIEAFVAGINAWVFEVQSTPSLLPPEFGVVGYLPGNWAATDLLNIRSHGLSSNAEEEVARAETLSRFGPEIEQLRRVLEPPHVINAPVVDPSLIDDSLLSVYRTAHLGVTFPPSRLAGAQVPDGSNNWAIAGTRTRSGRPILANDPHRIMTSPSLRVLIQVTCPEFDIIGMQEPYLPGVLAGHNAHVAFGITIAPADLEDLYVYELHPTDDSLYRYDNEWLPFQTVVDDIPVAGAAAVRQEFLFTRHGPVLRVDRERRAAIALRAAWLAPGMTPYLASVDTVDARDVDAYLERLEGWGNPVLNHVVADISGRIAWQVAGRVPERPNWDGLLPVPGDGSHEWSRLRNSTELPGLVDPEQGWVRSANQSNLAEDPEWAGSPTSHEWYSGYRARRLAEVLAASDDWTVDASAALQNDYLVIPAAELMGWFEHPFDNNDAEYARAEIIAWDRRMTTDSRAAALFDRWLYTELPRVIRREAARRLAPDGLADAAAETLLDARLLTLGDARADIRLLAESRHWAPSPTFASTHELVAITLASAVASLRDQLGADRASWTWGAVHFSRLVHPLDGLGGLDPALTDTGLHPKAGSSDTLGVSFGAAGVQTLGAATRIVIDVGDWDASVCINSPGQDGALGGAHALDQYDRWLADGYLPLVYSREHIEQHVESRHRLRPRNP